MLLMNKYLLIAVGASAVAGGAYFYYSDTQKRIGRLIAENTETTIRLEQAQASAESEKKRNETLRKESKTLSDMLRETESRLDDLRVTLLEHDLENLAREKPGLIENRINKATKEVFEQIESLTNPEEQP